MIINDNQWQSMVIYDNQRWRMLTCSTMNGKERRLDYQCRYSLIRFLTGKLLLRYSSATDAIISKSWPQRNAGKVMYPNAHQNGHKICVRIRKATQDTQWNEDQPDNLSLQKRCDSLKFWQDIVPWPREFQAKAGTQTRTKTDTKNVSEFAFVWCWILVSFNIT